MLKRDWFGHSFKDRLPILALMMLFLGLYFPINQFNAGRGGFVPRIDAIDNQLPLIGIFVVPYVLGFLGISLLPVAGAIWLPRDLFQAYFLALFTVAFIGFSLWLLLPAYVVKDPITQEGFFVDIVKQLHGGDDTYGTHNAIPSSHVYYVTIAMCYFIQWKRALVWPFGIFAVLNALSTLFTKQHYVLDMLAGFALVWFGYEVTRRFTLPMVRGWEGFLESEPRRSDPAAP